MHGNLPIGSGTLAKAMETRLRDMRWRESALTVACNETWAGGVTKESYRDTTLTIVPVDRDVVYSR